MASLGATRPWVAGSATLFATALGTASAQARAFVSFGIGVPLAVAPPVVYAPAPLYYAPPVVVAGPPPVVQTAPSCSQGQWRQQDGSIVAGVACLQPNGSWTLTQ